MCKFNIEIHRGQWPRCVQKRLLSAKRVLSTIAIMIRRAYVTVGGSAAVALTIKPTIVEVGEVGEVNDRLDEFLKRQFFFENKIKYQLFEFRAFNKFHYSLNYWIIFHFSLGNCFFISWSYSSKIGHAPKSFQTFSIFCCQQFYYY